MSDDVVETEFLRSKLKTLTEIIEIFKEGIYNMVMADTQFYQDEEIDIWEIFLEYCLTDDERKARGWDRRKDLDH